MARSLRSRIQSLTALAMICAAPAISQEPPELRVGKLPEDLKLDGVLDEPAWQEADAIDGLTTTVPVEGGTPSGRTVVRVLANSTHIVIGVRCDDPDAAAIVAYSSARDSSLRSEDHIKIVFDTFLDGRGGHIFAVNPRGARYDALVANRGEGEDEDWDGIWEAKTTVDEGGWTVEIRIPVRTMPFGEGLDRWHFNIERRVQRLQETSRWASPKRDYRIAQTSRAGFITELPRFDLGLGLGLSIRPAGVLSFNKETRADDSDFDADASLDMNLRLSSEITAALTINTDFAETEVDSVRTNLTRFPLFFPEKRAFFVEGADAFDFGLGLGGDVVPFHSRRIGLVNGNEVPLLVGGKVTGKVGGTSFGTIVAKTDDESGVAPESTMGVVRVRQDVLKESSIGIIATTGDPLGRDNSWLAGTDFTYQTSEMFGNRNFLVGVWGLTMDREGLGGDSRSAWGTKIDYPNDLWDNVFHYRRIGEDFDPSLGFIRRRGIHDYRVGTHYAPRPDLAWLRQTTYELSGRYITDLDHRWESYEVSAVPINWDFESGDKIEVQAALVGERIDQDFDIAEDVIIPPDKYEWERYEVSFETASKRPLSGEVAYGFGPFYDGHLDTIEIDLLWHPIDLLTIDIGLEHNRGRLPQGNFTEDAYIAKIQFKFSPDLTLSSLVQYESEGDELGTNTRLRWTMTPVSELFFVVNYNWEKRNGSYRTASYDNTLKIQHEFRF